MEISATEFIIDLPNGYAVVGISLMTPRYMSVQINHDSRDRVTLEYFLRCPDQILCIARTIVKELGGTEPNYRKLAMFLGSINGMEYMIHCMFCEGIPAPQDWELDYYTEPRE